MLRRLRYYFTMMRVFFLGFVLLTAACGNKSPGLCGQQVPAPAGCDIACNPAPGSINGCPDGYHCSGDGKCDLFCTQVGHECGDGYSCTADGYCIKNGDGPDSGSDPDVNCPAIHFSATQVIPSIQLLVDRSSSMTQNFTGGWPEDGAVGPYKYPEMQKALIGPQGVVTQLASSVYFGATLFTTIENPGADNCLSLPKTGRARDNLSAISTLLADNPPRPRSRPGFTPTPAAIDAVVADFLANPPPSNSPPVIVLATDGLPNECNTTTDRSRESVMAATNAFNSGIKLYILAIAIEGAAQHVQDMANAGLGVQAGQPNAMPYSASNPTEMAAKFQEIIRSVQSCDLTLEHEVNPAEAQSGTVTLNGVTLTYGTDWTVDSNGVTLHLLGSACTTLKESPDPVLDAGFPCGVVIL